MGAGITSLPTISMPYTLAMTDSSAFPAVPVYLTTLA